MCIDLELFVGVHWLCRVNMGVFFVHHLIDHRFIMKMIGIAPSQYLNSVVFNFHKATRQDIRHVEIPVTGVELAFGAQY